MMLNVLLLFLLINSFYVVYPINSSMIAALLCAPIVMAMKQSFSAMIFHAVKKYIYIILIALLFLGFFIVTVPVAHRTAEISYLKSFVAMIIQLICTTLVVFFVYIRAPSGCRWNFHVYISKLIVYIFLIQSIIQVIAFVVPEVAHLIHKTYTPGYAEIIYEDFNGIRGLALTGSAGWGLTVGYSIAFMLFFKVIMPNVKYSHLSILMLFLLILGNFFAGRSGFIGLMAGVIYYTLSNWSLKVQIKLFFSMLSGALMIFGAFYFIFSDFYDELSRRVFPFVFELFYNMIDSGEARTWSTDILMNMWKVDLKPITLIFGDGMFMDASGLHYYKKTDVGYLRNTLYGGVFFSAMVILVSLLISPLPYLCRNEKKEKYFYIILFVMLGVLEAKAMVFSFSKYAYTMLFIMGLSYAMTGISKPALKSQLRA